MKKGDRVRVVNTSHIRYDDEGEIVDINPTGTYAEVKFWDIDYASPYYGMTTVPPTKVVRDYISTVDLKVVGGVQQIVGNYPNGMPYKGINFGVDGFSTPPPVFKRGCSHSWKPVLLLTSTVYDCAKCGIKKEEAEDTKINWNDFDDGVPF